MLLSSRMYIHMLHFAHQGQGQGEDDRHLQAARQEQDIESLILSLVIPTLKYMYNTHYYYYY